MFSMHEFITLFVIVMLVMGILTIALLKYMLAFDKKSRLNSNLALALNFLESALAWGESTSVNGKAIEASGNNTGIHLKETMAHLGQISMEER